MPTKMKSARRVKNSSTHVAPDEAKFVSREAFEIEKNGKNRTFMFVLLRGLYKDFLEFDRNYCSANPHQDCVEYLFFNYGKL